MTVDEAPRSEVLAKLALSRQQLRQLLEPQQGHVGAPTGDAQVFPRSRTMKVLMSGGGLGVLTAVAGGLLVARPALALRLLKMLPSGPVAKLLAVRILSALRQKSE